MEQADTAYGEAVKTLEDARQVWEREMENMCQVGEPPVSVHDASLTPACTYVQWNQYLK